MDDEYKLKLKKLKKNSFQLFDSDSKLINFNLENCYLKFGIENYNDKKISNIFYKFRSLNSYFIFTHSLSFYLVQSLAQSEILHQML